MKVNVFHSTMSCVTEANKHDMMMPQAATTATAVVTGIAGPHHDLERFLYTQYNTPQKKALDNQLSVRNSC